MIAEAIKIGLAFLLTGLGMFFLFYPYATKKE